LVIHQVEAKTLEMREMAASYN